MAKDKKLVEGITSMDVDFAQWYTDVCRKAELIDYSSIKGMFIYRPYGYAIWENIQREMDRRFKETGHENVYLPMLIPESLLQKEKDHVEGFAPECAWVTYGGSDPLEERYCIRPTSETLFCEHYKNIIHSHRDLPKLYNQWCSVLRWEKTSRPFLRHREFLWQEGHTMHADAEEARAETQQMLNIYADFLENVLAMPVVKGQKTDKEKFNGAEETYTVECMMHDRKALQAGTQCPTCLMRITAQNLPDVRSGMMAELQSIAAKGQELVEQKKGLDELDGKSEAAFEQFRSEDMKKLTEQLDEAEKQRAAGPSAAEIRRQIEQIEEQQRHGTLSEAEWSNLQALQAEVTGIEAQIQAVEEMTDEKRLKELTARQREENEQLLQYRNILTALAEYAAERTELAVKDLQMPNVHIQLYDVVRTTGEVVDVSGSHTNSAITGRYPCRRRSWPGLRWRP